MMKTNLLQKNLSKSGVLTLKINRQEKKNALTAQMYSDLTELIRSVNEDSGVVCLVITGGSECFCAGADLSEAGQARPEPQLVPSVQFLRALSSCTKPVLASVSGPAIGIGMTMLLHCDLVCASPEARFGTPFSKLGLTPEGASSWLLPRLVGRQKAARLLLLGEALSAQEASELGLVTQIFPATEVLSETVDRAEQIAALSPAAIRETKRLIVEVDSGMVAEKLLKEIQIFNRYLQSDYAIRVRQEFLAKSS